MLYSSTETLGESAKLGSGEGNEPSRVDEPGKSVLKEPSHPDDLNVKVDLTSPLLAKSGASSHDLAGVTEEGANGDSEEEAAAAGSTADPDSKPLKYPSRLLYIFLRTVTATSDDTPWPLIPEKGLHAMARGHVGRRRQRWPSVHYGVNLDRVA